MTTTAHTWAAAELEEGSGAGVALLDDAPRPPASEGDADRAPPSLDHRLRTRRIKTVLLYALTIWAVVTVVFLLPRLMPGDPLQALDNPDTGSFVYDPAIRERVSAYYGLDRPLLSQYGAYLADLARGDLGWSISQNVPVSRIVGDRLPWTLLLTGSALALASLISFVAGIAAAWRRGGAVDRTLIVSLSASRAVPEYALASMLLIGFAVFLPIFPQAGGQTAFADYGSFGEAAIDVLHHLVLPLTALTAGLAGHKFLLMRNTMISALGEDYMLLARAKGLSTRRLKYAHAARNALLPFMTALGVQAGFAVGGSLFVESVFAYPGMGTLVENAVTARDYPMLQGTFLVLALAVLAVNLLVELTYSWIDPRVVR